MASKEPEKGDKVSWNWGSGAPGGTVAEKKTEGEIAIKSKRGNTIKKNAEPNNPAVHIERSGNDVVKKASELNVEKKAGGGGGGKKRKESEKEDEGTVENKDGKEVRPGGKKAKTEDESKKPQANGEKKEDDKAKAGRPKKGAAKEKTKKASKPRSAEGIGSRTRSQGK